MTWPLRNHTSRGIAGGGPRPNIEAMSDGFHLDPDALGTAADTLAAAGEDLQSHSDDTSARPDAGKSSDEVADALRQLGEYTTSSVLALTTAVERLRSSIDTYTGADATAQGRIEGVKGELPTP